MCMHPNASVRSKNAAQKPLRQEQECMIAFACLLPQKESLASLRGRMKCQLSATPRKVCPYYVEGEKDTHCFVSIKQD